MYLLCIVVYLLCVVKFLFEGRGWVGKTEKQKHTSDRVVYRTSFFFLFFLPVLYHKFFITAACLCPRHTGNLGNDATHRQAQGFVFRVVVETSNHDGEANKTLLSFRNLT